MARVCFKFRPLSHPTEVPVIVGNALSLGQWNPMDGCRLTRWCTETGQWCSEAPVLLPIDTDVEYKYVFIQGKNTVWERLPCNRVIRPTSHSLIVEDEEGVCVSKIYVTEAREYASSSPMSPSAFMGAFDPPGFSEEDRILIVSSLSPIHVISGENTAWEFVPATTPWVHSLYQTALTSGVDFQWICILSCPEDVQKILAEQYHITAVACPAEMLSRHHKFCDDVLEPIMQGLINLSPEDVRYPAELWDGYRGVNSLLTEAIMNERREEDLIWLHDFQLLMTASFLGRHQLDPPINIGLSLHSPFPPPDIFRTLPNHEALLKSILACDFVSFQCFGNHRSFLTTCKQVLSADHCYKTNGLAAVSYLGREIATKASYCGVTFTEIEQGLASHTCQQLFMQFSQEFANRKVVFSVEKIGKSSWLYTKLMAFRDYLRMTPASRLTLVQIYESRPLTTSLHRLYERIQRLVDAINTEMGRIAVVFREVERCSLEMRLAYLKCADLYWDCALQGFSPIVVEFALVHRPVWRPIVLSPFSLLSSSFKSVYCVNPFNFQEILDAFQYSDWIDANSTLYDPSEFDQFVCHEASTWGIEFLIDLKQARKNSSEFVFKPLGLGDKLNQVALRRNFDMLQCDKLSTSYKRSNNRLILLSNEGALVPNTSEQHRTEIVQALEELCKDERNSIYVLADCGKSGVEEVYGGIRNLGLVAEEGGWIKDKYTGFVWQKLGKQQGEWKVIVEEIIAAYVERVEGAVMIRRETMVIFGYKDASQDFGALLAKELLSNLEVVLQLYREDCEIVTGSDFIQVKSIGCDKGSVVQRIAQMVTEKKGPINLMFCIGDGPSDEDMFTAIHSDQCIQSDARRLSCTVGMKPSQADYYVRSPEDVWKLVKLLKDQSVKVSSYIDSRLVFAESLQ